MTILSDIRVIEFSHAVMGPAAGLVLADMGAEVIRIEPAPQGDHTRRLKGFGTGYYTFFNRNKKSVAINLKTDAGRKIAQKLLQTADVLIENFAPGTMERLGFGYEAVAAQNPALIYCSLKGFMPGPYAERTALDEVVQMMSGLAYMTGPPGRPLRAGASIVDIMGGTYGALAVLAALREREKTGRGQLVQSGLFETA
ncbi:MAG TPA: CoA transferase, partial [Anaerolineae bacterium]|nr:CoA transferase [Anaerolineae bacterium]